MSVKQSKTVLEALQLLEFFTVDRPSLSLSELTKAIGLPKSNVYRLVMTLEAAGYVRRVPGGTSYSLGLKLYELGSRAIANFDLRTEARPYLIKLKDLTGETAHLAILDGVDVVYLDKADSANPIRAYTHLGGRSPAYAVATGLALLAFQPESRIQAVIDAGLKRFTETTITHPDVLRERFADIRERRVAVNMGGWNAQVLGISSPVISQNGEALAAIGISMPVAFAVPNRVQEVENYVITVADELSRHIGGSYRKAVAL